MGRSYGRAGSLSAGTLNNLGQQMAHVLRGRQWRTVRGLFDLAENEDGPFSFSPADTRRMVEVFRAAAAHPLMPADWAQLAGKIAATAADSVRAGTPWEWS